MRIKAVILDVYGTLLQVDSSRPNAESLWHNLYYKFFNTPPPLTFSELSERLDKIINSQHEKSKKLGIQYPEILFDDVLMQALPQIRKLNKNSSEEFIFQQSQIWHKVWMTQDTADMLKFLKTNGMLIGIASNAQPYTIRELQSALASFNLSMDIFINELTFFSFNFGFSKPDPYVFQILSTRLKRLGIADNQVIMVGDNQTHDCAQPAIFGWDYWLFTSENNPDAHSGNWDNFISYIKNG